MSETFFRYVSRLWLSQFPVQLMRSILVAVLFEVAVYLVNSRIRKALTRALSRDAEADPMRRLERRRVILGIPTLIARTVLYTLALLIILRIFRYNASLDLYPIALGILALVLVAARNPLRDAVAGYFIFYDYLYDQGDEITVGEITGTVTELALRHTRIQTRDGHVVVLPNSMVRPLVMRSARGAGQEPQGRPGGRG
ncbi:MAG: mechanosensitive ion channel [Armatimonadetes bacterium]|jgi:small conductance mechanosensitive channel|nr:mechanosensitive ion channel [Armatimonadota bacterium]MDI9585896.1 mechanosensitive ion channel [Acidobacteriota bacterium]